jgi:predicted small integral membrane protein
LAGVRARTGAYELSTGEEGNVISRYLKIVFVMFVGVMAALYALQNIANLDAAFQVVSAVMAMENHNYYASSLTPAIHSPVLVWIGLAVIIAAELLAGLFAFKGGWDLWCARHRPAAEFNAAKRYALLGCGIGVLVWFGFFGVIGGAWFQMWQTELGGGSLTGAFQYFGSCALVLLFVNQPDT